MLKTPLSIIHDQETLLLKKIKSSDEIEQATTILNNAFSHWANLGFKPQTEELTRQYLIPDGYAVFNSNVQMIGTVCLRKAEPTFKEHTIIIPRAHKIDQAELYDKENFIKSIQEKTLLYGYGFAVDPQFSGSGIGQSLVIAFEHTAKKSGYHGAILETGKDALWLVEWYKKIGFEIFAESDPKLKKIKTVMLLKWVL